GCLALGHGSCGTLRDRAVRVLVDRRDHALERGLPAVRAAALLDVRLELLAVLVDVTPHRPDGEVAERAQRPALDAAADAAEEIEVRVLGAARLDLLEQRDHP